MVEKQGRGQSWQTAVFLIIIYAIVACLLTWPLVRHLDTHLVGRTTDALVHYWNGWWVAQAWGSGQSPFFTPYLSYPDGASLVAHNFAWFNILPWLLLSPPLGGIVAYNLTILLLLLLCGLTMYWLAYDLLRQPQVAFVAGLVYLAWPFRLSQLDHPNLVATFWMPVFFVCLRRLLQNGRFLPTLFTGLSFALVGYSRWQLLIPVTLLGAVYTAAQLPQWRTHWQQRLLRLALAAAIGLLVLLPPLRLLLQSQNQAGLTADLIYESDERTVNTDWLAYLTPSRRHPLLRGVTDPLYARYYPERTAGRRYPAYVGTAVLLLTLVALRRRWRQSWPWLLMALLLMLLASGTAWRLNGQLFDGIPTLYTLLAPAQLFRLMRIPERYVMFVALPLALLAGSGWQALLGGQLATRRGQLLTLLLAGIILFEYVGLPVQMEFVGYDKQLLQTLAADETATAVLNLPLRFRFSKEYMFDQTSHGLPILQGHVSREPDNLYAFIKNTPWFDDVAGLTADPGVLMEQLAASGISHVLLHKPLLDEAAWRTWQRHLPYAPLAQDDRYLLYATRPQPVGVQSLVPNVGVVSARVTTLCTPQQTTVAAQLVWQRLGDDGGAMVQLTAVTPNGSFHSPPVPLADAPFTVSQRGYTLMLPAAETAGTVSLTLVAADGTPLAAPLLLGDLRCDLEAAQGSGALFGGAIRLLGYTLAQREGQAELTLYWLALARPVVNYKVFVHVVDPATGEIVAQTDTLPRGWAYPTTQWQAGDLVADPILLAGVPAGTYELLLGLYEADTGQRLPVAGVGLVVGENGRLLLPEMMQQP